MPSSAPSRNEASFDQFVRSVSPRLWRGATRHRRTHHGGRRCPSRVGPYASGGSLGERAGPGCDPCVDEHTDLLVLLWTDYVQPRLDRDDTELDFLTRPTFLASRLIDVHRRLRGRRGYTVRPDRTVNGKVFQRLLPDPLDRRVLLKMAYFASSNDFGEETFWPYRRVGDDLGLQPDEVRERFLRTVEDARNASDARLRRFVERNIDTPVRDRGFGINVPGYLEPDGRVVPGPNVDPIRSLDPGASTDPVAGQVVQGLTMSEMERARSRLRAGSPVQVVLKDLVGEVLGRGAAELLSDQSVLRAVLHAVQGLAEPLKSSAE